MSVLSGLSASFVFMRFVTWRPTDQGRSVPRGFEVIARGLRKMVMKAVSSVFSLFPAAVVVGSHLLCKSPGCQVMKEVYWSKKLLEMV